MGDGERQLEIPNSHVNDVQRCPHCLVISSTEFTLETNVPALPRCSLVLSLLCLSGYALLRSLQTKLGVRIPATCWRWPWWLSNFQARPECSQGHCPDGTRSPAVASKVSHFYQHVLMAWWVNSEIRINWMPAPAPKKCPNMSDSRWGREGRRNSNSRETKAKTKMLCEIILSIVLLEFWFFFS